MRLLDSASGVCQTLACADAFTRGRFGALVLCITAEDSGEAGTDSPSPPALPASPALEARRSARWHVLFYRAPGGRGKRPGSAARWDGGANGTPPVCPAVPVRRPWPCTFSANHQRRRAFSRDPSEEAARQSEACFNAWAGSGGARAVFDVAKKRIKTSIGRSLGSRIKCVFEDSFGLLGPSLRPSEGMQRNLKTRRRVQRSRGGWGRRGLHILKTHISEDSLSRNNSRPKTKPNCSAAAHSMASSEARSFFFQYPWR